jgi:hypothetical protein
MISHAVSSLFVVARRQPRQTEQSKFPKNTILIIGRHTKAPDRWELNIRLGHLILVTGYAMLIT